MDHTQQSMAAALLLDPGQHPGALLLATTPTAEAEQRFNVHRNTVVRSLITALAEGFPSVHRLVGQDFFEAMAIDAVRSSPPRHPVLLAYGAEFPAFIERFEPCASLPYLADVARLDGLRRRAYHAADVLSLEAAHFAGLDAETAARCRIVWHPSVAIFASAFPARSIWAAQNDPAATARIDWQAEASLVFRQGQAVAVIPLDADLQALLVACQSGAPLAEVLSEPERAEPFSRALALGLLVEDVHNSHDDLFDAFLSPLPNARQ